MRTQQEPLYEFGPFRLDVGEKLLLRNGQPAPLSPKAFETLAILVRRSGHLVEKEALLAELWPDTFVEESALTQNIYLVRKALGEGKEEERYVETVPRYGYRFIAEVTEIGSAPLEVVVEERGRALMLIDGARDDTAAPRLFQMDARHGKRPRGYIVATGLFALLALASLFLSLRPRFTQQVAPAEKGFRAIAVLPLRPIAAGESDEHIGLGIADAIIAKLSGLQRLSVRPTSAVFKYTNRTFDAVSAGRDLDVDAVLDGTFQLAGGRIRVSVQLTSVRDARSVWADRFDEQLTNVFELQDSISRHVAGSLSSQLSKDETTLLAKRYTENADAYQSYVRGLFFWNKRTEEGLTKSVNYFEEAIAKDPNYALAYAGLADSFGLIGYYGFSLVTANDAYQKAKAAAMKALELDDSLAEAHTAMALIKWYYERDAASAENEHRKAIQLNPAQSTAHHRYAVTLRDEGRIEEALQQIQQAHDLDPLSQVINHNLGYVKYILRDYDGAADNFKRALETEPNYVPSLLVLGLTYEQEKKYDQALALFTKAKDVARTEGPIYGDVLEALGHAYAVAGRRGEAVGVLQELDGLKDASTGAQFKKMMIYAGLGQTGKAIDLLEQEAAGWASEPSALRLDPRYDKLRSDPRYAACMKRHFGPS